MSLLIFALIVVLIAVLLIAVWKMIPNIPDPLTWAIPVIILIIAIVLIAARAGVF